MNIQGYEPEVCWVWRTYRKQSGYGEFDRIGAHRVAFWLATGVEPGDAHVLHSCDNPPCVRPSHLRLGSHLDNMADKVRRGRVRYYTVIPVGQVADMRRRYLRGERVPDLADRFRISFSQAQRIVTGRSRKGTVELPQWRKDGFRQANTLLTDEQVAELRLRYAKGGISQRALAREYGICQPHISRIVAGVERSRA